MSEKVLDGRFKIEEVLASGSYGTVHKALDLDTGKPVALKILKQTGGSSGRDDYQARFAREGRLLKELNHPNAVNVLEMGITPENLAYVAMEFIDGQTLAKIVGQEGSVAPDRMAYFLHQIASVLDAAHARNIVHRDVKPGNIMVATDPEGNEIIKVLDFGVAKILNDNRLQATVMTMAGVSLGTPDYMSPELALGREIDKYTDIYSLGVLLFAVLTGYLPFREKNDLQTMFAHVKKPIPRFSEKNPENTVPLSVEGVVRKAMAKDPNDRWRSARELAEKFAEAVANPDQIPEEFATLETETGSAAPAQGQSADKSDQDEISLVTWIITIIFLAILIAIVSGIFDF